MSNSYGEPEGEGGVDFVAWHAIATQAGLKGVGLYFSSGDNGDEVADIGFASADFPASLDVATGVGGTSLALDEADKRVFEVGWETGASQLDTSLTPPDWNPHHPLCIFDERTLGRWREIDVPGAVTRRQDDERSTGSKPDAGATWKLGLPSEVVPFEIAGSSRAATRLVSAGR